MKHKILLLLSLILILLTATTGTLSAWASINLPNVVAMEFFSDYAEAVEGHSIYSSETITDFAGNVYKLCVISPKGYLVMCSVPFSVTDTGYVFVELDEDCSCVSCGIYLHDFHINLLHFTSTYHYQVCSKCNYSAAEEHIMRPKPSGLYCEICGYDTTSSGEITLGTGEHTH